MSKDNQKQLKTAFSIVFLLFLIFFILVFFYFRFYVSKEIDRTDALSVVFNPSNVLEIENKLPLSDTLGKEYNGEGSEDGIQEYIEFTVENKSNVMRDFYILLDKQSVEKNEFLEKYIKIYLTNEKDEAFDDFMVNPVPSFSVFPAYSKVPSSKVIYKGSIDKKQVLTFRLRSWLSDTYSFSSSKEVFSANINVE